MDAAHGARVSRDCEISQTPTSDMRFVLIPVLASVALGVHPRRGQAANDPASCPYCDGSRPSSMEPAGIVSHGGFEFGDPGHRRPSTSTWPPRDIRWIETEHFEIGIALGQLQGQAEGEGQASGPSWPS